MIGIRRPLDLAPLAIRSRADGAVPPGGYHREGMNSGDKAYWEKLPRDDTTNTESDVDAPVVGNVGDTEGRAGEH